MPTNTPSTRFVEARHFGLLSLVSDVRGRNHGSMSSAAMISVYGPACSRHCWEVPAGHDIAARTPALVHIFGRVWALCGSRGM